MKPCLRRGRRASTLPVVMGLVVLLGFLLSKLSHVTRSEARLSRTQEMDAEHLYRAEGIMARVLNRLKKRPWLVRYYAEGGPGTGPFRSREVGTYRGGDFVVWLQDVSLGGVSAVPGLVDVFMEVRFESIHRNFHYRLSVLPESIRRRQAVRVEFFDRIGGSVENDGDRIAAAEDATARMRETQRNGDVSSVLLSRLPGALRRGVVGGRRDPAAGEPTGVVELVDTLISGGETQARSERRRSARKALEKGIHLMGSAGQSLQEYLSPLDRQRFVFRDPNFGAAKKVLKEARGLAEDDPGLRAVTSLALARAYAAQAWRLGPASQLGKDLLTDAWGVLDETRQRLARAGMLVDPTLEASVLVDLVRVGKILGHPQGRLDTLLDELAALTAGIGLYGGSANADEVAAAVLTSLDTPEARARIGSRQPMSPSGFPPVREGEVDGFMGDPDQGWAGWPVDSGRGADWWEDYWDDAVQRDGEGGTGAPSGDLDRDGDGLEDPDTQVTASDPAPEGPAATDPTGGTGSGDPSLDQVIAAAQSAQDALAKAAGAAQAAADSKTALAQAAQQAGNLSLASQLLAEAAEAQKVATEAAAKAAEAADIVAQAVAAAGEMSDPNVAAFASKLAAQVTKLAADSAADSGVADEAFQQASDSASAVEKAIGTTADPTAATRPDAAQVTEDLTALQEARDATVEAAEAAEQAAEAAATYTQATEKALASPPDLAGALEDYAAAQAKMLPEEPTDDQRAVVDRYEKAALAARDGDLDSAWKAFDQAESMNSALGEAGEFPEDYVDPAEREEKAGTEQAGDDDGPPTTAAEAAEDEAGSAIGDVLEEAAGSGDGGGSDPPPSGGDDGGGGGGGDSGGGGDTGGGGEG